MNRELIGREPELETLDHLIGETGEGEFRLLQVEGEPGIGKSRLLAELAEKANRAEWLVLRGSAAEFESELPFGPVIDALDAYLTSLDPRAVRLIGDGTLEVLAEVFPSLADFRNEERGPAISSERFRIHNAIRELLERLSGRAPLLLILDDLHWADQASVELIGYLLRRPPQAGILVATANRTGLLDPGLAATLATSGGSVTKLSVSPLDFKQTVALTGVGKSLADRVFTESGGNPFYALELTRADPHEGGDWAIPETVAAALATEISSLGGGARRFAEAAAVAGDPFEIDLAASIAGDESDRTGAINELSASGLIQPTEVPRRFAFRHPLVRSAIYESVMPGTRLADHEKAARVLAAREAPVEEQARHLVLAARPGDREAARTIGKAAARAQASAPVLAAAWSDASLRLAPSEDSGFRLEMLTIKAHTTAAVSRFEEARAALLEAIDLVPEDQTRMRVELTSSCAAIEELLGRNHEALNRLTGLLSELEEQGSPLVVDVMLNLAHDAFLRNDNEAMTNWSERGLRIAIDQPDPDPQQVATAQATRAICASFAGPIEVARECADKATEAFDGFNEEELGRALVGIARLCGATLYLERFDDTIRLGELGIETSRRTGQGQNFPMLYPCIGTAGTVTGNLALARRVLDDAIDSARISNDFHALAWSLFNRANLALVEGNLALADDLSGESLELLADLDSGFVRMWAGVIRGGVYHAQGRYEEAISTLRDSAGGEALPEIPGSWRIWFLAVQTEALIALERVDDAARASETARARAEEFDNGMAAAQARRAQASVALARGDASLAAEHAREALELAETVGAKLEANDVRLVLAEALRQSGNEDEAATQLDTALDEFSSWGAELRRKKTEKQLRAMGRRIHRRSGGGAESSGPGALTNRELEVAELVVDRRTNKEIAETLFLSQKTVETHLRNIFSKLGVSTRVEVAREMEERSAGTAATPEP